MTAGDKILIIYRCDCMQKNLHRVIRISGFQSINENKVNIQNQLDFYIADTQENAKFWSSNRIQKYHQSRHQSVWYTENAEIPRD